MAPPLSDPLPDPLPETLTASAQQMYDDDHASQALGIEVTEAEPGRAVVTMTVRPDQANGLGVCHGGLIFTLADTAMAFATNAGGQRAFATNAEIDFIDAAQVGDTLTAACTQIVERGRAGVSDVRVSNQDGTLIAVFRGRTLATRS